MQSFYFVDTNIEVCRAFQKYFGAYPNVEVFNVPFQELPQFDCLVSPANSYGRMTGGVDRHIRDFFGLDIERAIQSYIQSNYYGEQPVGTSFILNTNHPKHPFLAHTPTMRIPMHLAGLDNVYNAMRGLLIALSNHEKENPGVINTVACTGFGTLVGGMDTDQAVGQMELAYRSFIEPIEFHDFYDVFERLQELRGFMRRDKGEVKIS